MNIYGFNLYVQRLIDEIDIGGDGQIKYEEFYEMMCTK